MGRQGYSYVPSPGLAQATGREKKTNKPPGRAGPAKKNKQARPPAGPAKKNKQDRPPAGPAKKKTNKASGRPERRKIQQALLDFSGPSEIKNKQGRPASQAGWAAALFVFIWRKILSMRFFKPSLEPCWEWLIHVCRVDWVRTGRVSIGRVRTGRVRTHDRGDGESENE